jgi:hypothetical protein
MFFCVESLSLSIWRLLIGPKTELTFSWSLFSDSKSKPLIRLGSAENGGRNRIARKLWTTEN